jgi:hypothetical protein
MHIDSKVVEGVSYSMQYPYNNAQISGFELSSITDIGWQAIVDELELLSVGYQLVASF